MCRLPHRFLKIFNLNYFSVSPDSLQIIEKTIFFVENMNDDIPKVEKHPVSKTISFSLLYIKSSF